jgi:hypothetical protein
MLSQAGVPLPTDPAAIVQLAAECLTLAMKYQHFLVVSKDWRRCKQIWRAGREARSKLLGLLPSIEVLSQLLDGPDVWLCGTYSQRTKQFHLVQQELERLDFCELELPPDLSGRWHDGAIKLARIYFEIVDLMTGWSRNGPAIRFLHQALCRAYPSVKITATAIELHLTRERQA